MSPVQTKSINQLPLVIWSLCSGLAGVFLISLALSDKKEIVLEPTPGLFGLVSGE